MCLRKKSAHAKSIQRNFAPRVVNSAEVVGAPPRAASRVTPAAHVLPHSSSNEGKDSKEKVVKVEPKAIVPVGLGSAEFVRSTV
ncbi:hypothetical protein OESDEN_09865 [Oesophagostomum dentatum]|uniref:Uncharacterized protein n=1 Tax=Oesophagostomum dentatum TaxID=61180 RepID=A0A0B1T4G8_OESDE|nr:hypothetical protein OESDEN_09865 [Oesophagostomum dentatum]